MRRRNGWRRFVPPAKITKVVSGDMFVLAWQNVERLTAGSHRPLGDVAELFQRTVNPRNPIDLLTLLLLQMPQAARAQVQMDRHPHGYRDRKKRLYELIDFNDTFVALVLLLGETQRFNFTKKLWRLMEQFSDVYHAKLFTTEQYEAITHGLGREVAVYEAAKLGGFEVRMTSRTADAFGVDMQIRDPESGRYINIDVKTRSAFHYRLGNLVHQGRLAPHEQDAAEAKGYWEVVNRRDDGHVRIILFRIDHEEMGEIIDFVFTDTRMLNERLRHIIAERGLSDGQFGRDIGA